MFTPMTVTIFPEVCKVDYVINKRKKTKVITHNDFNSIFAINQAITPLLPKGCIYYKESEHGIFIATVRKFHMVKLKMFREDNIKMWHFPYLIFNWTLNKVGVNELRATNTEIYTSYNYPEMDKYLHAPNMPNAGGNVCYGNNNPAINERFNKDDLSPITAKENIFLLGIHNSDLCNMSALNECERQEFITESDWLESGLIAERNTITLRSLYNRN